MTDGIASTAMPGGSETILLVEDEPEVRALARRTLEGLGYTVLTSVDSSDAVRLGTTTPFDLVLSDIVMPAMSGPQVVARLADAGARPIIVYMSGYADDAIDKYELDSDSTFLRKPFSPAELAQTIRAAIDRVDRDARGRGMNRARAGRRAVAAPLRALPWQRRPTRRGGVLLQGIVDVEGWSTDTGSIC